MSQRITLRFSPFIAYITGNSGICNEKDKLEQSYKSLLRDEYFVNRNCTAHELVSRRDREGMVSEMVMYFVINY